MIKEKKGERKKNKIIALLCPVMDIQFKGI
jgi:hypothetical protein